MIVSTMGSKKISLALSYGLLGTILSTHINMSIPLVSNDLLFYLNGYLPVAQNQCIIWQKIAVAGFY